MENLEENYQNSKRNFEFLKNNLKEKKLLEKAPIRGGIEIIIVFSLFLLSLYSIEKINPLITAILFAITMIRSTYVAHDTIHNQYFGKKYDDKIGYIFGDLILGFSGRWWAYAHNVLHHTFPNAAEKDEDIQAIGGTFIGKNTWNKTFHKYQHILYWFALPFIYHSFVIQSLIYNYKRKSYIDIFTSLLHFLIPLYIFKTLNITDALILTGAMYTMYGYWFSFAVITNHIGCEVIEGEDYKNIHWLELQTRTSRNIIGGFLIHWLYGGLNTQIEHHLFPKVSRFNLLKIAKETEQFCLNNNIKYHQTSIIDGYKEIYEELKIHRIPTKF